MCQLPKASHWLRRAPEVTRARTSISRLSRLCSSLTIVTTITTLYLTYTTTMASKIDTVSTVTTEPENLTEIHAQSGLQTEYTSLRTYIGLTTIQPLQPTNQSSLTTNQPYLPLQPTDHKATTMVGWLLATLSPTNLITTHCLMNQPFTQGAYLPTNRQVPPPQQPTG